MPGYKHSDVGEIPDVWDAKQLGEIGDSLIGLTYRPAEVRNYGTLVLRSSNVQNGSLCFDDNVFVEADIPERIMVRPGDILVCVRNGSRDLIGKSALIDERAVGMTFGAFMAVFRSEDGQFLLHVFQSGIFKKQINEHLGATINQITNKSLNSFKVPLPPTNEERTRIASALSDFDALLTTLDQVIAKKRDLKQAAMQQLLLGQMRLPGFHGGWSLKKLGEHIVPLKKTTRPSSLGKAEGAYPFFTNTTKPSDRFIDEFDFHTEAIIANTGGEAYFNYYNGSFAAMADCFVFETKITTKYLYYFLKSIEQSINDNGFNGSGIKHLDKKYFSRIEAYFPDDLLEQAAISEVLSDMDAELTMLELRRDKTHALKQAMMHELLTGRTRLL
jgi:type I restriction enzyme S subunit